MRVLVTGAAGFIGSHVVWALVRAGHEVLAVDNLATGHRVAVDDRADFRQLDVRDTEALEGVMRGCDAVLNFAPLSIVPHWMHRPLEYWHNNVGGCLSVLRAIHACAVKRLVFSSTAATYGIPEELPITDSTAQAPINPYGESKLASERMISDCCRADGQLAATALRYFNVAGSGGGGRLGEDHRPETHLIPIVVQAAVGLRDGVYLFGTDYDTPDGTCVRDYVHVDDLVDAHLLARELAPRATLRRYNVGTGKGFSVREVVDTARRVTGVHFQLREAPRREGDPPSLYTDSGLIQRELGWTPRRSTLDSKVESTYRWRREHPDVYASSSVSGPL